MNNSYELDAEICKENMPTGKDLYKWARENKDKAISMAVYRVENIFDEADEVSFGFSGGKDSTLSANLAICELKRRHKRVINLIARNGEKGIDELDAKWVEFKDDNGIVKNGLEDIEGLFNTIKRNPKDVTYKKLWYNTQNCEWWFTDAAEHALKFVREHGPLGDKTINVMYKCICIGWQSGVTFGDDRLISWDPSKKDMWITPMPTKEELGVDPITNDNIFRVNPVPLNSLTKKMQEERIKDGSVFVKDGIEMVAHHGLGTENHPTLMGVEFSQWTFSGQDEDYEQETFAQWFQGRFPQGTMIYNLVSLRASESMERMTILKQSDYSTGNYATVIPKI